jgi:hypothetical protein
MKLFTTTLLFLALALPAYASTSVVTGSGVGFLDSATQEAIREMQNKCYGGQLSNIQTVGVSNDNGFYTVEMVAVCNR